MTISPSLFNLSESASGADINGFLNYTERAYVTCELLSERATAHALDDSRRNIVRIPKGMKIIDPASIVWVPKEVDT